MGTYSLIEKMQHRINETMRIENYALVALFAIPLIPQGSGYQGYDSRSSIKYHDKDM